MVRLQFITLSLKYESHEGRENTNVYRPAFLDLLSSEETPREKKTAVGKKTTVGVQSNVEGIHKKMTRARS